MRDATELPADLLDGRLAPSHEPEDSSSAARIAQVAQLADRGEHQAAAREAAGLIEDRIYDVRLIGFYLFGVFLQRGIAYLPALLGRVEKLVTEDLAVLRPTRRKLQVVSSATAWLFEHVSARLLFHTKHRDATWEAWRGESDSALADAIASGCSKATLALEAVINAPLAVAPLARIRRWTNDDLRRAVARREATAERGPVAASATAAGLRGPEREPRPGSGDPEASTIAGPREPTAEMSTGATGGAAPQPVAGRFTAELPEVGPHLDDEFGESPDEPSDDQAALSGEQADGLPGPWPDGLPDRKVDPTAVAVVWRGRAGGRPVRAGSPDDPPADPPDDPLTIGSPALATLQAKLRGFQDLIARGELAKAAIVASDVRAVLANFDPVAFFPAMFAGYFKALHQVIDELTPYFDGVDLPSWHALDSYYRADMRAFFDD